MCNQILKHAAHQSCVMLVMLVLSDHCLTALIFKSKACYQDTLVVLFDFRMYKLALKYDLCKQDTCFMIKSLWLDKILDT